MMTEIELHSAHIDISVTILYNCVSLSKDFVSLLSDSATCLEDISQRVQNV